MSWEAAWGMFEESNPWFIDAKGDTKENSYRFFRIETCPDTSYVIDLSEKTVGFRGGVSSSWFISSEDSTFEVNSDNVLEDYFTNYRKPTQQEAEMFEVLFGIRLPWDYENPLVFPNLNV